MNYLKKDFIWRDFHENTKIFSGYIPYFMSNSYNEPRKSNYKIENEKELVISNNSFYEVFKNRKSDRDFIATDIPLIPFSNLLYYSYGKREDGSHFTPSAGARYPLELHVAVFHVVDIVPGIYHYNSEKNSLELINTGDYNDKIYECLNIQDFVKVAGATIIITADITRTSEKYRDRGYRYVLLDAGHVAQNMYLIAAREQIGIVGIGGFRDNDLNELFQLPRFEQTIYAICIGNLKE